MSDLEGAHSKTMTKPKREHIYKHTAKLHFVFMGHRVGTQWVPLQTYAHAKYVKVKITSQQSEF